VESFHLSPEHYPASTRDLLPTEVMLDYGVVPLGYKHALHWLRPCLRLNLGLVDPRRDAVKRVKRELRAQLTAQGYARIRLYQVRPREFLRILDEVYAIAEGEVRKRSGVAPALRAFLDAHAD
jgi:hypothetical protein